LTGKLRVITITAAISLFTVYSSDEKEIYLMEELVGFTARKAVNLLKRGEISPMDLIDAAALRISETDGAINAMPILCFERARKHAEKMMTSRVSDPPACYLYGLPIAVKDLNSVAGVRSTLGSPIYADNIPDRSDYMVETLEGNGAIVIGKSNTPEFGAGGNTFNEVFGATRNPWDVRMTAGGSSGGAAAALATGQVWLATGSDLAGSLRIPASYCSVVGLRPSPGRVAYGPDPLPFGTLSVEGPMGRTVGDVALMLDAQTGIHPDDPRSFPKPAELFISAVDHPVVPKRVAYSPDLGIAPVVGEVKEICAKAADSFSGMGAIVEETGPDLHDAEEIFQVLRADGFAAEFEDLMVKHRDKMKPELIWNIEKGLALDCDDVRRARMAQGELYHRIAEFFQGYDLLLCPAVVAPPFEVNIRYLEEVDDVEFDSYIGWLVLTYAITLTASPAISVPCGFTRAGLPVGLQMIGPPRGEAALLSAAALIEEDLNIANSVPIDPVTDAKK
jgi:amidase